MCVCVSLSLSYSYFLSLSLCVSFNLTLFLLLYRSFFLLLSNSLPPPLRSPYLRLWIFSTWWTGGYSGYSEGTCKYSTHSPLDILLVFESILYYLLFLVIFFSDSYTFIIFIFNFLFSFVWFRFISCSFVLLYFFWYFNLTEIYFYLS